MCAWHMTFFRETLIILWSYSHVQLESPDYVCVFLPCLRSQSWLCVCARARTYTHTRARARVCVCVCVCPRSQCWI